MLPRTCKGPTQSVVYPRFTRIVLIGFIEAPRVSHTYLSLLESWGSEGPPPSIRRGFLSQSFELHLPHPSSHAAANNKSSFYTHLRGNCPTSPCICQRLPSSFPSSSLLPPVRQWPKLKRPLSSPSDLQRCSSAASDALSIARHAMITYDT